MCLILVAWRVHAEHSLILAANRDESYERPATQAAWWQDRPQILAGRDLRAGGTWLGITKTGNFAALTNFRGGAPKSPDAPSRGALVIRMLESQASIQDRLAWLKNASVGYPDFNLLCADRQHLGIYESTSGAYRLLEPGIYGLSNHLLDTPWPKVQQAKSKLAEALGAVPDDTALLNLLRDDRPAADSELPRTGISMEWERLLSSAFIRGPAYGTRCSTIVRIGAGTRVEFREWTWNPDGSENGDVRYRYTIAD